MINAALLADLIARDLVEVAPDPTVELDRQRLTLRRLESRSSASSPAVRYLAQYDALMRIVEIELLASGYRFGSRPHRCLKTVLQQLGVSACDVDTAVAVRHQVKKAGRTPSQADSDRLEDLSNAARLMLSSPV